MAIYQRFVVTFKLNAGSVGHAEAFFAFPNLALDTPKNYQY